MKNQTRSSISQTNRPTGRPLSSILHWIWVLAALALVPRHAQAQAYFPPGQISYQGFLTDANGAPLATNTPQNFNVAFRIYNSPTTTTALWGELQTVTVDHGYFSVLLGVGSAVSGTPNTNNLTTIFAGSTASSRYLGMTVTGLPGQSTATEIQPRLQLLASPYSLLSSQANSIVANTGAQVLVTSGTAVGIGEVPNVNDGLDVKGNVAVLGNIADTGNSTVSGTFSAAGITSTANLSVAGSITTAGLTDSGSFSLSGALTAGSVSTGGTVTAGNITDNGNDSVAGTFTGAGLVSAAKLAIGGGSVADGIFSLNGGFGHFNDNKMYLRGGADHNHWLGYDNTIGTDGPGLVGFTGGVLGTTSGASAGSYNWALYWYNNGNVYVRNQLTTYGSVGIGTSSPGEALDVAGAVRGWGFSCRQGYAGNLGGNHFNYYWTGSGMQVWVDNVFVGNLFAISDRRLKEGINSMEDKALERVMALKPTAFKFKNIPGTIFTGSPDGQEGFLADELQEVIPSAVTGQKDALTSDGQIQPQTINIIPVVSVLTKAVQEQEKTILNQQKQIDELKSMLKALSNSK